MSETEEQSGPVSPVETGIVDSSSPQECLVAQQKKRGRPKGSKDRGPRKQRKGGDTKIENMSPSSPDTILMDPMDNARLAVLDPITDTDRKHLDNDHERDYDHGYDQGYDQGYHQNFQQYPPTVMQPYNYPVRSERQFPPSLSNANGGDANHGTGQRNFSPSSLMESCWDVQPATHQSPRSAQPLPASTLASSPHDSRPSSTFSNPFSNCQKEPAELELSRRWKYLGFGANMARSFAHLLTA